MATTKIGEILKSERTKRGLSLRELGKMIDIPPTHISRLESGMAVPKESILKNYSDVFGIPLEELLALAENGCSKKDLGNRILLARNQGPIDYLAEHPELLEKNIKLCEKCFIYLLLRTPRSNVKWYERSCTIQIHYAKNGDNPACDMILDHVDGMYILKSFDYPKFNYKMNPIQKDIETVELWK